jgi:hypothetical protein
VIEKAIEYHYEKIMPFQAGIYSGLFWNVQKIYGVLAIHTGKLDFGTYLHKEKKHFTKFLGRLFDKLAFLEGLIVE